MLQALVEKELVKRVLVYLKESYLLVILLGLGDFDPGLFFLFLGISLAASLTG